MHVTSTTRDAATHVLFTLLDLGFRLGVDFQIIDFDDVNAVPAFAISTRLDDSSGAQLYARLAGIPNVVVGEDERTV